MSKTKTLSTKLKTKYKLRYALILSLQRFFSLKKDKTVKQLKRN